jgi:phosphoglycerate dehydrogenase-like enzyme
MAATNVMNVACLGFVFDPAAQDIIRAIAPDGFAVSFAEKPADTTAQQLAEADFLMTVAPVTEAMIQAAPRLRMIQKWGSGYDKIDIVAAERQGVTVAITAGANATVIAEHTVLLMLAVMRRLIVADRGMREGGWNSGTLRPDLYKLEGKTIGILGFGNIGRAVARMVRGFDTKVLYHRRRGPDPDAGDAEYADFDRLIVESDVLTIHCPGGPANRNLVGRAALSRMKPGAVIVNTARGEIVDQDALVEALETRRLGGAGLDVFQPEPPPADCPLRRFDNVVLTPHVAGSVIDHVAPMALHGFGNMQRFLRGEPLPPVDLIVAPQQPRQFADN